MKKIAIMLAALTVCGASALLPVNTSNTVTANAATARASHTICEVTGNGVRIRKAPNTSSTILGLAYKGDTFKVIGYTGNWKKIEYKGKTAYISADYAIDHTIYH